MALKKSKANFVTCAENISLLYLLHSVPSLPCRNMLDSLPHHKRNYTLSVEDERHLVGALAFLSSAYDDVNHIPAICVEESPDASYLRVMLAVNRSGWHDGEQILQQLKQGFEKVFDTLTEESDILEGNTMTAIISMCSQRILRRLRFAKNRPPNIRQPIQDVLRVAIEAFKQLGQGNNSKYSVSFVNKAKDVIKAADAWMKYQTIFRIRDLVDELNMLNGIGDLRTMFSKIPNRLMAPSTRENLANIASKVARYREIARSLCRMTKKHPILRHMSVVLVNLPQSAYNRVAVEGYNPSLVSHLNDMSTKKNEIDLSRVTRSLNLSQTQADTQFVTQITKTLQGAKIHAEIQLLYYYELNSCKLPPRIITSSKDACFLCNNFILMHGKTHVSRTHGRLYPGWRLPNIPNLVQLEQRFNVTLATQIKASITTLISRGQKTVYPDPNESTLLTLPHSASTLSSLPIPRESAVQQGLAQINENQVIAEEEHIAPASETPISLKVSDSQSDANNETDVSSTASLEDTEEIFDASNSISLEISSAKGPNSHVLSLRMCDDEVQLEQGFPMVINRNPTLYIAGSLELNLEYPTDGTLCALPHNIEWLTPVDTKHVLNQKSAGHINVDELLQDMIVEIDDESGLLVATKEIMVRITLQSKAD
ncbi:hypothetical protein GQ44DRAFT_657616 [Phaeosphaeriaceae sp. PMI808]|nr:hypothetical protein GQ44DRAFT_657616 [Phaeosphaeriaceae sp. PMI808]